MKSSSKLDPREDSTWESVLTDFLQSSKGPVHFVGLGNSVREDDGVGLEIVALLQKSTRVGGRAVFHHAESSPEMLLAGLAQTSDRVVVFDAVQASREPGYVVCAGVRDTKYGFFATHNIPLILIPGILEAADRLLLVGVQPLRADVGEGLTPAVRASAEKVSTAVRDAMGGPR